MEFFESAAGKLFTLIISCFLCAFILRIISGIREFRHRIQYIKTEIEKTRGKRTKVLEKEKTESLAEPVFPFYIMLRMSPFKNEKGFVRR